MIGAPNFLNLNCKVRVTKEAPDSSVSEDIFRTYNIDNKYDNDNNNNDNNNNDNSGNNNDNSGKNGSDIRITTDTPYLALTGELWGAYYEDFGES